MRAPTRRLLLTSALTALAGAAVAQPYGGPPRAYAPVPELRVEPMPPPPGSRYIWRPGHWVWTGSAYVWAPGVYLRREPYWHEWVHGGWVLRRGVWVWVPPHWR
jgi:hypothetical protein